MRNYRDSDFDDNNEDGENWSEYDPEDEVSEDCAFYNDICSNELTNELALLDNRGLLEFITWELERLEFEKFSHTILVGLEFDGEYILQLYNVRENDAVKMRTGAGNVYSLIDGWFKNTVSELMIEQMFGGLHDMTEEDMIDINTNMLLDLVEWKQSNGIELMKARGEDPEHPEEE